MEHIDIKFIAKKSGCSIATVSRVINRSKPVSEELQKRVIDTIRKYNYNPSIYAQNLAGKKSKLLGFIMTNYINQYQLKENKQMKKLWNLAFGYFFAAMAGGVFYRMNLQSWSCPGSCSRGIEFQRIYLCFHLTVFRLRDA